MARRTGISLSDGHEKNVFIKTESLHASPQMQCNSSSQQMRYSRNGSLVAMRDSTVRHLAIEFDRKNGIYMPGELVSGRVLVEFTEPKEIRGLRVVILGESVVHWSPRRDNSEHKSDSDDDYHLTHSTHSTSIASMTDREENFSSKFYLLGSDSGPPFVLPTEQLSYPFECRLPVNLPRSFEHEHGYVRYTIKAIFDRPWKFDYEVKTAFVVNSTYDLNRKPEASMAVREDILKNFFCSCICPTGKIYARFSLPSIGFVVGQVIPVTVDCGNESTIDVTKIKVSLHKAPRGGIKLEESIVAEINCLTPFTDNSEDRVTIRLKVPPLSPTGLEHCKLMDVDYVLQVVMCFSGMHFSVKRRFPILIGTVPLNNFENKSEANVEVTSHQGSSAVIPHSSHWGLKNLSSPSHGASLYEVRTIEDKTEFVYVDGNLRTGNPYASRDLFHDYSPTHVVSNPSIYDKCLLQFVTSSILVLCMI